MISSWGRSLSIQDPFREAVGAATVEINVTDQESESPLPCRITIAEESGALAAVVAPESQADIAIRPGVVYTGTGRARVGLRQGGYSVFASRGCEYGVALKRIGILEGRNREIALKISHEVATPGLVSCDTHIHTLTHSGHGDATLDERMLTLAGEGVELPIATEHNFHADYAEAAHRLGMASWFTPVIGNEVTTEKGHFNIFPVTRGAPVPDFKLTEWPRLMAAIRDTPGVRVAVLNHPRSIHTGFRPFDPANFIAITGENKVGPDFTFDALEVLNSGAQQTDYLLVYRDWFGLLNHGYRITTVGASDSHDVSRFIVGQARTYISVPDNDVARIDVAAACRSLVQGRSSVSMGLLVEMKVEGKFGMGDLATGLSNDIQVEVRVLGASWVQAKHLTLYANGLSIFEQELAPPPAVSPTDTGGEKARVLWSMRRPNHDVHLVAIATGPAVTAPFWAMTKPYQPSSTHWQGRAIGSTNPIWIDADNDGKFMAARAYARRLVDRHGVDPRRLVPALSEFDEAVAAQAASLCAAAGAMLDDPDFSAALSAAPMHVVSGFAKYRAAAKSQ